MARRKSSVETLDLFQPEDFAPLDLSIDVQEEADSSLNVDLFRRSRTLAVAGPLLQSFADARKAPFNLLDHMTLALQALDFSIRSVGLGSIAEGGVQRQSMAEHLVPQIREQLTQLDEPFEFPSDDQIKEFALSFVSQLLNNNRPYQSPIFNTRTQHFQTVRYRLLEEVDDASNQFYIRPTVESTNLFLSVLDQSLEDAQIALQALLEHQIRRGRVKSAFKTAQDLRTKTLFYKESMLRFRRDISTNVKNVSWREHIRPKIAEIQDNLPFLLDTNRKILRSLQDNLELRLGEKGLLVGALMKVIADCIKVHVDLTEIVGSIDTHFRTEQGRQAFFPQALERLPNLVQNVLEPLMTVGRQKLPSLSEALVQILIPPSAGPIFDLTLLAEDALRPRRVIEKVHFDEEELDLAGSAIDLPPNVSEEDVRRAEDLLLARLAQGPVPLSVWLAECARAGESDAVLHGTVLLVHATWQDGYKAAFAAEKTDSFFFSPLCSGDDFLLEIKHD